MLKFFIRKIAQGVLMLIMVSAIAFALLSSVGGDALVSLRDNPQVSAETVERLRATYGLDKPVSTRYLSWLRSFSQGDMGESFFYKTPVAGLVFSRLSNTVVIGLLALLIALTAAIALSFISVSFPGSWARKVNGVVILFTASTPRIVLSLLALLMMASLARNGAGLAPGSWPLAVLSAFVMSVPLIAVFLAQIQNELASAMKEPFVEFARAKGLSEATIIFRHASRSVLNPVLSIFGLSLGSIIGGSVIVETVLGWQGIGALMVSAVRGRDVSLVMGVVVIASTAVWLGNTIAEFLQMVNDKRLRGSETN